MPTFDPSAPYTTLVDEEFDRLTSGRDSSAPATLVDKEFSRLTRPRTKSGVTAPAFDPNQPFQALGEAGAATATAPVKAAVTTTRFDPSAKFSKLYTVEEFKAKPEAELTNDIDFSAVEFGAQNKEALQQDPEALEKIVRVYQAKDLRGTTLGEKATALKEGIIPALEFIGKGIKSAVTAQATLNPVATVARLAGAGTVSGGAGQEARKITGEQLEVPASVEASAAGTGDLLRRFERAIEESGKLDPGAIAGRLAQSDFIRRAAVKPAEKPGQEIVGKTAITPEKWRSRYFQDVAGLEQSQKAAEGNGAVLEALNANSAELSKFGVELRPDVIQELSLLTDPINYVPVGASVGVVAKIGGKLSTRVIATAVTAEQAARVAEAANMLRGGALLGSDVAGKAMGMLGRGVEKAGVAAEGIAREIGAPMIGTAGVLIGEVGRGAGIIAAAKLGPKVIKAAGRGIKATGEVISGKRPTPGFISVTGETVAQGAAGVGEGLLLTLPFEIGARPEEESMILGAAGAAGVIRAGLTTAPKVAKAAGTRAQNILADTIFKRVEQADIPETLTYRRPPENPTAPPESVSYGNNPELDSLHSAAMQDIGPQSKKLVDWVREKLRDSGAEVYVLNQTDYGARSGNVSHGFTAEIGQRVSPEDGSVSPVLQIFLNRDVEALPHELFHVLEALDPEGATALEKSVASSLTPDQKNTFSDLYHYAINNNKPKSEWTTILSDKEIASETAAEVFSRAFLGQDLSSVALNVKQNAALFASSILEKLGAPLARIEKTDPEVPKAPGVSTLGLRPSAQATRAGISWVQSIVNKLNKKGGKITPEIESALVGREVVPGEISTIASPGGLPSAVPLPRPPPIPQQPPLPRAPVAPPGARNIRVTREQQNAFSTRRSENIGIENAKQAARDSGASNTIDRVNEVSALMEQGNPILEIDHRGIRAEGQASGRTARRAEQSAGYIAEGLGAAPDSVRERYQKVFAPVRWEVVGGKPQLLAMSMDKVIANLHRAVKDSVAAGVGDKIPYEIGAEGKLTEAGWDRAMEQIQSYSENQANGYRGDGNKFVRPTEDLQTSIPPENPGHNPVLLPEDETNFLNLLMGLAPPFTARGTPKGKIPGNIKGQTLARLQGREPQVPSVIRQKDVGKQTFPSGERVVEVNPLRNELAAAGVPVRELIEVTERINAEDILSVRQRPDLDFKAPVTDIIRSGFLPGEKKFMPKLGQTVAEYGQGIVDASNADFRAMAESWQGGVTSEAFRLGRSVTSEGEVALLKQLETSEQEKTRSLMRAGALDYEAIGIQGLKAQFFREAWEAATGKGGAGPFIREYVDPNYVPPFATEFTRRKFEPDKPKYLVMPEPGKRPLELEIQRRLDRKKESGIPVTDIVRKQVRAEVEFDARNNRLGQDPNKLFLPAAFTKEDLKRLAKYNVPEGTRGALSAGWILPNNSFVSLSSAHEQYLAENAGSLNKKFGTNFSAVANVDERLLALNKGFVRIRGGAGYGGAGALHIELNQRFFKGKTKTKLETLLSEQADNVDRLYISILNDDGKVVDTTVVNVTEKEGREREGALIDTLNSLRPKI